MERAIRIVPAVGRPGSPPPYAPVAATVPGPGPHRRVRLQRNEKERTLAVGPVVAPKKLSDC
eukprot:13066963-Alexandrium_andersonii.AAC.1